MSWVQNFYAWLFGRRPEPKRDTAAAPELAPQESARPIEETLYVHTPEDVVGHAKQHQWLFDDGVLHWNQRRLETEFKPHFAGVNFVKEGAKSRLWGRPGDLVGDERAILYGIDLRFANLQGCIMNRVDLRNAKLQGANLRNANLTSANLTGADLTDCDLRGATLDGAIVARARLVNANLSGASLKGTNFAWSDVTHMMAGQRNLQDANMFGVMRRETSSGYA